MNQATKDIIFERANSQQMFIVVTDKNKKQNYYSAQLYGRLLAFPVLRALNNDFITAEINWTQAERIANGLLKYIHT